MLFNSLAFLIFFPVVTLLYYWAPHRWRWLILLSASSLFYMFFIPIYILILMFTIVIDYFAGILIQSSSGPKRKAWLVMSIVSNVGVLAFFKYYNFMSMNLTALSHFLDWNYSVPLLGIILPIGLSFHTFQAMSYTIEVYRGHAAERHFGIYALYVMFYPQLVAGPIERPQNLLHQFRETHLFDYQRVTDGLKLMAWGFFKKAVIADRIAVVVDHVYRQPESFDGLTLGIATVLYAYQIYCDFSGYSDIAIGAAQVMGFKLMANFKEPYFSRSISEFWKRWHISLSTWFRDYLYIPLGGNRVAYRYWCLNVMLVFLVSGLWHGANWTYVVWGGLHGSYFLVGSGTAKMRKRLVAWSGLSRLPRLLSALQLAATFGLVCFAWIFFRAANIPQAIAIAAQTSWSVLILPFYFLHPALLRQSILRLGLSQNEWLILIGAIGMLELIQVTRQFDGFWRRLSRSPLCLRWAAYYTLATMILIFGRFGAQQFIYFQF